MKPDIQVERVQSKYEFPADELIALGRQASAYQTHRDELDAQLSSIKSDYKGKIESAESLRDVAFRKLTDGYEMREVQAVIDNLKNRPKLACPPAKSGWVLLRFGGVVYGFSTPPFGL
jgi:hypothetical protein